MVTARSEASTDAPSRSHSSKNAKSPWAVDAPRLSMRTVDRCSVARAAWYVAADASPSIVTVPPA